MAKKAIIYSGTHASGKSFKYVEVCDADKVEECIKNNTCTEWSSCEVLDAIEYVSPQDGVIVPEFNIETVADVINFFHWLNDNDLLLHPGDSFKWILEFAKENGDEPRITEKQAEYLDNLMSKCFEVCEYNDKNVYELHGNL